MALVTRLEPKIRLGTRVVDFAVLCLLAIITKINLQIQSIFAHRIRGKRFEYVFKLRI